ncbi:MAG: hypothetical protein DDT28_01265 [Dehalococcoidia bacterium]|nr:hypothetical protein [Chloroflexota bacterium]
MIRDAGDYIQDVIDAMNKSMKFVEGIGYSEFRMRWMPPAREN